MKKLALVVGSLLVVSAVASAKEVVPAPKQVAQEAPVKVVEKVVVKEVPVEKVVEKVVVKEVAAPKKWQPSGEFDVNYGAELYTFKLNEKNAQNDNKSFGEKFLAYGKKETLSTSSKVTFAPKHSIQLKTKTGLNLIPTKDNNVWKKTGEKDGVKSAELIYTYKYNNLAKLNLSGAMSSKGKTVKVNPVFDVKEYFFKNDYVSAKSLAFTPAYSYTWKSAFENSDSGIHRLTLGAKAKFALPADVELELDFSKFFILSARNIDLATPSSTAKYNFLKHGEVEVSLGKEFALYENGNHSVDLGVKGKFNTAYNWTKADITKWNTIKDKDNDYKNDKDVEKNEGANGGNYFYKLGFGAEAELTYNYKFNDYAKLYTTLSAELNAEKNRNKLEPKFENTLVPKAKVGFKVTF